MKITVGKGSCGLAAGAGEVFDLLKKGVNTCGCGTQVELTGCIGMCYLEPIVNVINGEETKTFVKVDATAVKEILKYVCGEENNAADYALPNEDLQNLNSQRRVALANCGIINPESLEEYLEKDGYKAARRCICELTPQQVIEEIKTSALCGRGGAGFPTWFKWNAALEAKSEDGQKYIICNADEGDPGAFMDRAIIEGDPHAMIEGMIIGAWAMGATEGIVYVRAEYPLAIARLEIALKKARDGGFLGENIFDSGFSFDIRIKAGAGAFVCGEETALIASLEGERGMPRLKPPFPAQKGYWQKPSNINNVETFANVPWIIRSGGKAFAAMGTENSKGTKVFALTGKIAKGGLVEVPMGQTLREVVFNVGGGIKNGGQLKAVQMGGPSGGCIPESLADTRIDYRSLAETGAIMGSGGMVVMDRSTCMVDMARFFLDFTCRESCGKCPLCRVGCKRLLEILTRICEGEGESGDIELLKALSAQIKEGSLCALGQTAPNPVLTTIRYFEDEYTAHIEQKKCPAKQCTALLTYSIDSEKCIGCTICARNCPVSVITGEVKKPHEIDEKNCTKCGKCAEVCKFNAVIVD